MITIAEHSFEETLLPKGSKVLDIGCYGMQFHDELYKMGNQVIGVDPQKFDRTDYHLCAITNYNGTTDLFFHETDRQATMIQNRGTAVSCYTLLRFSQLMKVDFWDLIKMDCEGSEWYIIMNMDRPMAKQLSIEFHLHTGIMTDDDVKKMEDKLLSLGYFPVKHDKTNEHGAGYNYWDSLWILKEYIK